MTPVGATATATATLRIAPDTRNTDTAGRGVPHRELKLRVWGLSVDELLEVKRFAEDHGWGQPKPRIG